MQHVMYAKLGDHRGNKRLWLEGRRLLDTGAAPGCRFDATFNHAARELVITITEDGARKVSGKTKADRQHPVIDLNGPELGAVFGAGTNRVVAVFEPGRITVTVHPDVVAEEERRTRLATKLQDGTPLAMGSLFHGAGVLDAAVHQGLADAGIPAELAWAVEIEPEFLEASLRNNPIWGKDSLAICGSVDEVEVSRLRNVEILTAGIPCTGASLSGRARLRLESAEHHPRAGHLFVAFLRIVRAVQPAVIKLENVTPYANTAGMQAIRSALAVLGYDLHETVLNGNAMGALENRDRLCAVAVTKGLAFDWSALVPVREKEATVAEILDPEGTEHRWSDCAGLKAKQDRDRAAYRDQGRGTGFAMQVLTPASASIPTITALYWKWQSTTPKLRHPENPELLRQFSPAEHARAKAIPFGLVAGASPTAQHTMLGQAVVFPAFQAVARLLAAALRAFASTATVTKARLIAAKPFKTPRCRPAVASAQLALSF